MFDAKEAREKTNKAIERISKKQIKEITEVIKYCIKCGRKSCNVRYNNMTQATRMYFENLGYHISCWSEPPDYKTIGWKISWEENEENK